MYNQFPFSRSSARLVFNIYLPFVTIYSGNILSIPLILLFTMLKELSSLLHFNVPYIDVGSFIS